MTTEEIELAISRLFNPRVCLMVPNVHWGFRLHECDVLVVRPSGYLVEVEIKRSKADLLADFKKPHRRKDREDNQLRIKELYYAIPECLISAAQEYVPERHGLIIIKKDVRFKWTYYKAQVIRKATSKRNARKITDKEYGELARLGCIRIWRLKSRLHKLKTK